MDAGCYTVAAIGIERTGPPTRHCSCNSDCCSIAFARRSTELIRNGQLHHLRDQLLQKLIRGQKPTGNPEGPCLTSAFAVAML
jgi:hypothetical protein